MRDELEAELERRIREGRPGGWGSAATKLPRDIIDEMVAEGRIASPKQAWRTLEKWARQKRYEYGVSLDLGWMLDGGTGGTQ